MRDGITNILHPNTQTFTLLILMLFTTRRLDKLVVTQLFWVYSLASKPETLP